MAKEREADRREGNETNTGRIGKIDKEGGVEGVFSSVRVNKKIVLIIIIAIS